jgi:hypothetical protein
LAIGILNVAIIWISWGVAPGYINLAPLGLSGKFFSQKVQFVPFLSISRGANYCVSHSTPTGLGPSMAFPLVLLRLLSRSASYGVSYSTPTGLGPSAAFPQVSPGAIHIQPLRGWGPPRPFPRFISLRELLRFIFNPDGVGALHGLSPGFLKAIISLRELLRFIFNPYGAGALHGLSPGFTWGYSYSTPTGLGPSTAFP